MTIKQKVLWEKLAKENSKYYIHSDKGRGITDEEFRESGKESYLRLIENDDLLKNKDIILDYGCGTGRLTEFMAKDYKKVIGIDISNKMITEGKSRLSHLKNIEFIENDGETIPLADNSISNVISYLVFQHFKEREMFEKAFRDIYRILSPNGIFKVLLRSDKQKNMNRWWSGVEYTQEAIKDLYQKIGFKLLKLENVDNCAYWLWLTK